MQSRPRTKRLSRTNRKAKRVRVGAPSYQLEAHQVIVRPIVTEKGTHQSTHHNAYCFEVHPMATKTQIRAAIESLFPVRVVGVRTQIRMGKSRRYRNLLGKQPDWKKAVVELNEEDRIEFF